VHLANSEESPRVAQFGRLSVKAKRLFEVLFHAFVPIMELLGVPEETLKRAARSPAFRHLSALPMGVLIGTPDEEQQGVALLFNREGTFEHLQPDWSFQFRM
jgi:hypothetical protein